MTELQKAKIDLYRLLLEKENEELADTEIELMYNLCKDLDVREQLNKTIRIPNNIP